MRLQRGGDIGALARYRQFFRKSNRGQRIAKRNYGRLELRTTGI